MPVFSPMAKVWNSTLKRKSGFKKRARPLKRKTGIQRRKPLKKISRSQKRRLSEYLPIRREFLKQPENRYCYIALCVSLDMHFNDVRDIIKNGMGHCLLSGNVIPASEIHHIKRRRGKYLCDTEWFCPSSREMREWPHDNPAKARELGLLA